MKIIKKPDCYLVQSTEGGYYRVSLDIDRCECPHFTIRLKKKGEACKHMIAVKLLLSNDAKDDFEKALAMAEAGHSYNHFIERFGHGLYSELEEKGMIIKENGKINTP